MPKSHLRMSQSATCCRVGLCCAQQEQPSRLRLQPVSGSRRGRCFGGKPPLPHPCHSQAHEVCGIPPIGSPDGLPSAAPAAASLPDRRVAREPHIWAWPRAAASASPPLNPSATVHARILVSLPSRPCRRSPCRRCPSPPLPPPLSHHPTPHPTQHPPSPWPPPPRPECAPAPPAAPSPRPGRGRAAAAPAAAAGCTPASAGRSAPGRRWPPPRA